MTDWKIFTGEGPAHLGLQQLPPPPPWRFARPQAPIQAATAPGQSLEEAKRAETFITSGPMCLAVNAALYLRRPLLLTGNPGTGKSTLIAKVAHELNMGSVLRWSISSRSSVRNGIYDYDAVGRLQAGKTVEPPVQDYLKLGPLGTALMGANWPRALLIDEIDKSDLDFANDLLNVIEDAECTIPELLRLKHDEVQVLDADRKLVTVREGRIVCNQFPFIVMTSNGEREFPAAFLRRCVRLAIEPPTTTELTQIVERHLDAHKDVMKRDDIEKLIKEFDAARTRNQDISTDQLLNAVFLTVAMRDAQERSFDGDELEALRTSLMQPLNGTAG